MRPPGFEPGSLARKASVLPLDYGRALKLNRIRVIIFFMKRAIAFMALLFLFVGCIGGSRTIKEPKPAVSECKVAIILANGFKDVEYSKTREVLEKAGVDVVTFGLSREVVGMDGLKVKVDYPISNLNVSGFDAIVLPGGDPGYKNLKNDERVINAIKEAYDQDKVVAAICASPTVLAEAGILKNKKATVWSSLTNKDLIKEIEDAGAIYVDEEVVRDGKIITANGPQAAEKFANEILNALGKC